MTFICKFLGVQGIFLSVPLFGAVLMPMVVVALVPVPAPRYVLETESPVNACVNKETVLQVTVTDADDNSVVEG